MKLLEKTEIKLEWTDIRNMPVHPWVDYEVGGGVSTTKILRYLNERRGEWLDEEKDDEMPLRVLIGMGWETMAARLYPEMLWQPGKWTRDGVIGHPDGVSMIEVGGVDGRYCIEEFKYTCMSERVRGGTADQLKKIEHMWSWVNQVMAYGNLAMEEYGEVIRLGRFHVCWARGNYVWPQFEHYIRYLVEFEERELESNWAMMVRHRDRV